MVRREFGRPGAAWAVGQHGPPGRPPRGNPFAKVKILTTDRGPGASPVVSAIDGSRTCR